MRKFKKNLYGASLTALAFSLNINTASAQTCAVPPTCEALGYTKSASDCGSLAALKCPFDQSKLFCTAFTDQNGNTLEQLQIGSILFTDGTYSVNLMPGKQPVGIVYDLTGKITYPKGGSNGTCPSGFTPPTSAECTIINNNKDKIEAALTKIGYVLTNSSKDGCTYNTVYPQNSCTKTFTINGTTEKTYAVGDTYITSSGTALGIVSAITDGGKHGTVVSSAAFSGTQSEVTNLCAAKENGGLFWGIASVANLFKVLKTNTQGCYWTTEGYCEVSAGSYLCNNSYACDPTAAKTGYCQAQF